VRYRYTQFDERFRSQAREKQLRDLFLQLLMHAGGDVDQALEWLDEIAKRHGLWGDDMDLEKFKEMLRDEGYITAERQPGKGRLGEASMRLRASRKAERAIRQNAFEEIFASLREDSAHGDHLTPHAGLGGDRLPETRHYEFGDRLQDLDLVGSFSNALRRSEPEDFQITEDDLMVHEVEHTTSCATVLALDISHSMILYGEDRITPAKKVALAMAELQQTRFPKDSFDVIVFGDDAVMIDPRQLAYVQVGPYHTNTKAALNLAQQILARRRHANRQIILVTDGKPSALTEGGHLYINSFGLDAKIVNRTIEEAQRCRRKGIVITTFMIASDPYLRKFVERLTEANRGRAYYADLDNLGKFVLMDFVKNRQRRI
jgi:Ca-activated chloride channel family protein